MFFQIVNVISNIVWNPLLMIAYISIGIWFTLKTKFFQFRLIKDMVLLSMDEKASGTKASLRQAIAKSIASKIGSGNLSGVAVAIAYGGPGAILWMWVISFLGAAITYVEVCVGQTYKEKIGGRYYGGPAYYIEKIFKNKRHGLIYALVFTIIAIVSRSFLLPGIQALSISEGLNYAFGFDRRIVGGVLALIIFMVMWGRLARFVLFVDNLVSVMSIVYLIVVALIMLLYYDQIPQVIYLILSSAGSSHSFSGGVLGTAISWGIKRGVYSNQSGEGLTFDRPITEDLSHPVKHGLLQAFSVYIDVLISTATAFLILTSGAYNQYDSVGSTLIVENLKGANAGGVFLQESVAKIFPHDLAVEMMAIMICFVSFATIMGSFYKAEANVQYIQIRYGKKQWLSYISRALLIIIMFLATQLPGIIVWKIGDIGVAMMLYVNLIAIVILYKPAIIALKNYEKHK